MTRPDAICGDGILSAVGGTPLIRLSHLFGAAGFDVFAKLESGNPGGSAKDRPARAMIDHARASGEVDARTTVVESSSGNMGIGLAQVCRYYNLPFICVVDPRTQKENLAIIQALGGQIEMVQSPLNGDFLAARVARVRELIHTIPNAYWPNQYSNHENPRSHALGTIREIEDSLAGQFDVLLVACSSTGTIQGCYEFLEQRGRDVRVIAVDAKGSVLFGGKKGPRLIPGLGAGTVPSIANRGLNFEVVRVTDLECVVGCRRLAKHEAILAGGSSGGVLAAIDRMQGQFRGQRVVAILHDSGTRYLDTVFNDQWVETKLHCSPEDLSELIGGSQNSTLERTVA